jgi:drug/metabolite transporter (DMT)-like permease
VNHAPPSPAPPSPIPPSPGRVSLSVLVLCLVWSSTWWAIRLSLLDLPPCTAAAARFLFAGALMTGAASALRGREHGTAPPPWLWVTMAVCNFAASYGILYATETVVPSGIAAVLWAVFPVLMAVSGHLFLGERVRPRQALGFLIATAGTVTMFCGDLGGQHEALLLPALLLLASPIVSAVGTTLVKRHGQGHSSLLLNRNAMLLGGALLAGAALLLERPATAVWSPRAIVATVYLGAVGTALTFGLYFWLLRWAQASRLGLISYVTPSLALLFGWLVGDGTLDAATLAGGGLVAVGIALVVSRHLVQRDDRAGR